MRTSTGALTPCRVRSARQSVRSPDDHALVLFVARLLCSDPDCADLLEASVASLTELDLLACECGCTWELLGVSLEEPAQAGRLRASRPLVMS